MELLNTEIKDLEISRSLKRLGAIQVMDWDFQAVIPAVKRVANQEVDVIDLFRRTAHYKVMDWDFRNAPHAGPEEVPEEPKPTDSGGIRPDDLQSITAKLKNFLEYVTIRLIDEPGHAQIKVLPLGPQGLRFKLVLVKKDVAMLIGREGFTAAAIRNILKATAAKYGVQVLLQIHSHEEEAAFLAKEEAKR
jgi:predicted RNA-binding protein YlqC (UPF0109 family)